MGRSDRTARKLRFRKHGDVRIVGAPYGFPGGVGAWMKDCRRQATPQLCQQRLQHVQQPVKIVARFYFKESKRKHDLDNALKVLIDSLGAAGLFKRSKGGGKPTNWNTDDHWVVRIEADKSTVASEPRVEVEIWLGGG